MTAADELPIFKAAGQSDRRFCLLLGMQFSLAPARTAISSERQASASAASGASQTSLQFRESRLAGLLPALPALRGRLVWSKQKRFSTPFRAYRPDVWRLLEIR